MTKSEFAIRLLFWLLPWPISKALPRALRIYYFGPAGEPQIPWQPGPPPPDFFPPTPIPPPPPDWPETPFPPPQWLPNPIYPQPPDWDPGVPPPPPFIINPGDPYIPGPGHPDGAPQPGGPLCQLNCDTAYWTPFLAIWDSTQNIWNTQDDGDGWPNVYLFELGTWVEGYRPVFLRITTGGPATVFTVNIVDAVGHELAGTLTYSSGARLTLDWLTDDIDYVKIKTAPPNSFYVTNIEFL